MSSILIVDDAVDIIQVLSFVIKKQGFDVLAAQDAKQAYEKLGGVQPALIFLDYNLPDQTGPEILKQLRSMGQSAPVILLSGQDNIDPVALGFNDFLNKPFKSADVIAMINKWVKKV